jgi:hypothetical protein
MTGISKIQPSTIPSGSALAATLKMDETMGGVPNDALTTFTISDAPVSGSLLIFRNENLMAPGGVDYTFSGVTATFTLPPETGDRLRANYIKA